jgi:methionyl-tRNA formyltransferase
MLLDVIKKGSFLAPLQNGGWYPSSESDPIDHAEKITKEHSRIDWTVSDIDDILLRHGVLGDLWCVVPFEIVRGGKPSRVQKRVVIHGLEVHEPKYGLSQYGKPGFFVEETTPNRLANADLLALTSNFKELESQGRNFALRITSCTTDGGKKAQGRMEILNSLAAFSN